MDTTPQSVRDVFDAADFALSSIKSSDDDYMQMMLGSDWRQIVKRTPPVELVGDKDPLVRRAAIYWDCHNECLIPIEVLVNAIRTDINEMVRIEAICAMWFVVPRAIGHLATHIFAEVALDVSQPLKCRQAVYVQLLRDAGRFGEAWEIMQLETFEDRLIDVEFVSAQAQW